MAHGEQGLRIRPHGPGRAAARRADDEHMDEEEHEGLLDFRRHVDLGVRPTLGLRFAVHGAEFVNGVPVQDEDPGTYLRENS